MKHAFLVTFVMISCSFSYAQDYLVTPANDTIRGELKPMTMGPDKKVIVRTADKKRSVYPILKVKSYSYKGSTYQPVRISTGYTFMKLIKGGYLSLFAFQRENSNTFDGQYLLKRDGSGMEVPNLMFKKLTQKFLSDCEQVSTKIDDGTYSKQDLEQIIDDYNQCIDTQTSNYKNVVAKHQEQSVKIDRWSALEESVKAKGDFEGKSDALEMIAEIKGKISRNEAVPNFLVDGLKKSLSNASLDRELEGALAELRK